MSLNFAFCFPHCSIVDDVIEENYHEIKPVHRMSTEMLKGERGKGEWDN
jgi:hypothetical protein